MKEKNSKKKKDDEYFVIIKEDMDRIKDFLEQESPNMIKSLSASNFTLGFRMGVESKAHNFSHGLDWLEHHFGKYEFIKRSVELGRKEEERRCFKCYNSLSNDDNFCPKCGEKIIKN